MSAGRNFNESVDVYALGATIIEVWRSGVYCTDELLSLATSMTNFIAERRPTITMVIQMLENMLYPLETSLTATEMPTFAKSVCRPLCRLPPGFFLPGNVVAEAQPSLPATKVPTLVKSVCRPPPGLFLPANVVAEVRLGEFDLSDLQSPAKEIDGSWIGLLDGSIAYMLSVYHFIGI